MGGQAFGSGPSFASVLHLHDPSGLLSASFIALPLG